MIRESEYHKLYSEIPSTLLEDVSMPLNYNLLSTEQLNFFLSIVDNTLEKYKGSYVQLLSSFQDELSTLKDQAQEIIDELND